MSRKIAVIGAGAAGLAAAIEAARTAKECGISVEISVFEQLQKPLRKLLATGNGHCNFSNEDCPKSCYHTAEPALLEAVLGAPTADAVAFFRSLGVLPYTQSGRIYPRSEQAISVHDALLCEAAALGVTILPAQSVSEIAVTRGGFSVAGFPADKVIVAAGGKVPASREAPAGGYSLLSALGHTVTPLSPALVYLKSPDKSLRTLKGVRVKAKLTLREGVRVLGTDRGEIQLTERGISGIPGMNLSFLAAEKSALTAELDLCEEFSSEALIALLRDSFRKLPDAPAETVLGGILPQKLGYVLMERAGIKARTLSKLLPDAAIYALSRHMKALSFPVTGTGGFESAQVTHGGIPLSEFRTGTLESKKQPGVYAAGEILDCDAVCGGYNLHFAWASGRAAGRAAILSL